MTSETLLPCPFCGGNNLSVEETSDIDWNGFQVWCEDCGGRGEDDALRHKAIAAWNRRTIPQEPSAQGVSAQTLEGETVNGIPVLAWMWEEELPGGDTAHSVAFHWSRPPSYAKKITRLADVDVLIAAIGAGGQAVAGTALEKAWTDFLDANPDDLTSPEDLPDHALMTCAQFVEYALSALNSPAPQAPGVSEAMVEAAAKELLAHGEFSSIPGNNEPNARIAARAALEAAIAAAPAGAEWREMPAPSLKRIIVAGWQEKRGTTAGYWWYHEDATDSRGVPIDHPQAKLWVALTDVLPTLPASPKEG